MKIIVIGGAVLGALAVSFPAYAQERIPYTHTTGPQIFTSCLNKAEFCTAYVAGVSDTIGAEKGMGLPFPEICGGLPIEEKTTAVVSFGQAHPDLVKIQTGSGLVIASLAKKNFPNCPPPRPNE